MGWCMQLLLGLATVSEAAGAAVRVMNVKDPFARVVGKPKGGPFPNQRYFQPRQQPNGSMFKTSPMLEDEDYFFPDPKRNKVEYVTPVLPLVWKSDKCRIIKAATGGSFSIVRRCLCLAVLILLILYINFYQPPPSIIVDNLWEDTESDGAYDEDEPAHAVAPEDPNPVSHEMALIIEEGSKSC